MPRPAKNRASEPRRTRLDRLWYVYGAANMLVKASPTPVMSSDRAFSDTTPFMRIDFVRHGETDWNRIRRVQGRGPVPLNALGERQAERLGERYRGEKIDALYASGLVRAMQTAKKIADTTGKESVVDERLAEVDHGEVEGLMLPELTAQFPDILRLCSTSPDLVVYPGG